MSGVQLNRYRRFNYRFRNRPSLSDVGTTLVEAALSVSFFLVLVLVITDIARYFLVYIVLNFATQSALDLAMKIPIEVYTASDNCGGPSPTACEQFESRVSRVMQRAQDIAYRVVSPSTVASMAQAQSFEHYDPTVYSPYNSGLSLIRSDVVFLRPGEKVERTASSEEIEHPTRPFGTANGQGWPHSTGESWSSVLEHDPIIVMMRASFSPITPLFPKMTITSRQIGYRKVKNFGGASRGDGLAPTPAPTPALTPVPTPTPSGFDCSCCTPRPAPPCSVISCVNAQCLQVGR